MTTTPEDLRAAIEEAQVLVKADGARLDVIDESVGGVSFRLDLTDVECADCVLPSTSLVGVVQTLIRQRTGDNALVVRIEDPRD